MEYYSALEEMSHDKTWINFKYILLSGGSQSVKAVYWVTWTIWHYLEKAKLERWIEDE